MGIMEEMIQQTREGEGRVWQKESWKLWCNVNRENVYIKAQNRKGEGKGSIKCIVILMVKYVCTKLWHIQLCKCVMLSKAGADEECILYMKIIIIMP